MNSSEALRKITDEVLKKQEEEYEFQVSKMAQKLLENNEFVCWVHGESYKKAQNGESELCVNYYDIRHNDFAVRGTLLTDVLKRTLFLMGYNYSVETRRFGTEDQYSYDVVNATW